MTYAIRIRSGEHWQGTRWIIVADGRTVAKGWARPDGKVDITFGTCPAGATEELAARFAPAPAADVKTVSDEEE